jgi:tetratricopeptide (TPR) repeat protein
MKFTYIKATLWVAFFLLVIVLSYLGFNKNEAKYDFKQLADKKNSDMQVQTQSEFENTLKNIGSSSNVVKPDVLTSNDTNRLMLSIQLLDTMKQFLYAAVLSERLANIQKSESDYLKAARFYLMELYKHDESSNELMLTKKAKENLEKCLSINENNLDAKVDLAVSIYNLNKMQTPENQMDLMKPALLLREVVASDSNHLDGLYYLGKLAVESNQLEKAIVRFKKLVSLQPQNREFYLELSQIYAMMGNKEESTLWEKKAQSIK